MAKIYCFSLLFLLLIFAGCGKTVKVTGKVTFADGTPLTVGIVRFSTDTDGYSCVLKPDGTYSIGAAKEGQGIPPGSYRVSIEGAATVEPIPGKEDVKNIPLIASKYTDSATSGFVCDVKGATVFDMQVEKP